MFVYLVRNKVNGKIYIGKCQNGGVQAKLTSHIWQALHNRSTNMKLHYAIRKYGPSSFTIELVECASNPQHLIDLEKKYIESFDARNNKIGYNTAKGGFGGGMIGKKLSAETREKMAAKHRGKVLSPETREKLKGRPVTDEWRNKVSASLRKFYSEHPSRWKGRKHSEETKKKLSLAKLGKKCPYVATSNQKRIGNHRKPHTAEAKQKIRDVQIKRWSDPSRSAREKEQYRQVAIKQWQDQEYRTQTIKKISDSRLGCKHSEETRRKISEAHKAKSYSEIRKKQWENPEYRNAVLAGMKRRSQALRGSRGQQPLDFGANP